jgi:hypothetical protein
MLTVYGNGTVLSRGLPLYGKNFLGNSGFSRNRRGFLSDASLFRARCFTAAVSCFDAVYSSDGRSRKKSGGFYQKFDVQRQKID